MGSQESNGYLGELPSDHGMISKTQLSDDIDLYAYRGRGERGGGGLGGGEAGDVKKDY